MKILQINKQRGITLISLVVTIIVLIILSGIAISMTVGDNGIFTKAKEAKRLQITSEAKEKIGAEILAAQVESIERNEELEQSQVEDIVAKYGILQDDKDTIILKDSEYKVSLLEIYQGTTTSSGSYTENKAKIELLEGQVKRLQEQLDSSSQTGDEKDKKIAELNEKITAVENEKAALQSENNTLSSKVDEVSQKIKTIEQQVSSMNNNLLPKKCTTELLANGLTWTELNTMTTVYSYTATEPCLILTQIRMTGGYMNVLVNGKTVGTVQNSENASTQIGPVTCFLNSGDTCSVRGYQYATSGGRIDTIYAQKFVNN